MRKQLVSLALLPLLALAGEPAKQADELLQESRAVTQRFADALQAELLRTLASGRPAAAVHVCRIRASQIADALARETGARIGRTSLKVRNPQNLPEPWQYRALLHFDAGGASAPGESLERFERDPGPGVAARYMKAIVAKPMCLACHGEPDRSVQAALKEGYPHDLATGYEAGDIRGAFYVIWPQTATPND